MPLSAESRRLISQARSCSANTTWLPACIETVANSSFDRLSTEITDENFKNKMVQMGRDEYIKFFKTVSDTFQKKTTNQIDFENIHKIIIKSINSDSKYYSEINYDVFDPMHMILFDDSDTKLAEHVFNHKGGYRKSRKSRKSRKNRKSRKSRKNRKSRKSRKNRKSH